MQSIAYCQECARYVELSAQGACPNGHARSALRDVRQGTLADAPAPVSAARASAPVTVTAATSAVVDDEIGLAPKLIGWAVVAIPVGLFLAFAIWTGYEQFSGTRTSPFMRVVYSAASLLLTLGLAWIWSKKKKRN